MQNLNRKMEEQRSLITYEEQLSPNKNENFSVTEETTERILSRKKRQFPVFGFLSFLILLVNSTLLISENSYFNPISFCIFTVDAVDIKKMLHFSFFHTQF